MPSLVLGVLGLIPLEPQLGHDPMVTTL
jgi:hypothetical protein